MFDYCETKEGMPKPIENYSKLMELFSRKEVARLIEQHRAGVAGAKQKLPVVCFHATFNGKARKSCNASPSGLFILDLDHVKDAVGLYKSKIQPVVEKEKIALVYLTPSLGLRVVAQCTDPLLTIAEHQAQLSSRLGVENDDKVKDLARCSFVGRSEEILYVNPELLCTDNVVMPRVEGDFQSVQPHSVEDEKYEGEERAPYEKAPVYQGVNLQDFVREWFADRGGMPEVGARNQSYFELGRDLRYLTNFSEQEMSRCVSDAMLNGFPRAELIMVFKSALSSFRRGSLPQNVVEILSRCRGEIDSVEGFSENALALPKALPALISPFVSRAPQDFKAASIISCLPVLGTICSFLRSKYLDGEIHSPSFMAVVEGEQASGKSFTRKIVDILMKPIKDMDLIAREEEAAYHQQLRLKKNAKEQPVDPRAKVRIIPASISIAKLLQRMDYAQGQHLFSYAEEIDTLYKSNRAGAWAQKSDIYRNAFDNAEYGQDYMSDNSYSTIVRVYYNLLMCGTPKAVNRFFPDVEDGLVTRVIFANLPDQFASQFPVFKEISEKKVAELQKIAGRYSAMSTPVYRDCTYICERLKRWLEAKRVEAMLTVNKAEDQFRRRAAVIAFRAGMLVDFLWDNLPLSLRKNQVLDFAIWIANFVLSQQMERFGERVNDEVPFVRRGVKCKNVFEALPAEFEISELAAKMKAQGYKQPPRSAVHAWIKQGIVEKIAKNKFIKTQIKKNETKG